MNNRRLVLKKIHSLVLIAITLLVPLVDVLILKNTITEISLTEFLQETMLAVITGSFLFLAFRRPAIRYGMILLAGFFACALIRELDFLFDKGLVSWFYVAMAVALVCIILAIKNKESTRRGLANFFHKKSFFIMVSGLLVVFVFSRLIGMKLLWSQLLGRAYPRMVKNVVEETTELFGYLLCQIASFKYVRAV
jgi:hypothetical protein